jgi:hypothetical protein
MEQVGMELQMEVQEMLKGHLPFSLNRKIFLWVEETQLMND